MPNHVFNTLTLTFENAKQRADFLKLANNKDVVAYQKEHNAKWNVDQETNFSLRKLLPLVNPHTKDFDKNYIDIYQSTEEWGTKWDTYDCSEVELREDANGKPQASMEFTTAWSSPIIAFFRIANKYGVEISNYSINEFEEDECNTFIDPKNDNGEFEYTGEDKSFGGIKEYLNQFKLNDEDIKAKVLSESKEVEPDAD